MGLRRPQGFRKVEPNSVSQRGGIPGTRRDAAPWGGQPRLAGSSGADSLPASGTTFLVWCRTTQTWVCRWERGVVFHPKFQNIPGAHGISSLFTAVHCYSFLDNSPHRMVAFLLKVLNFFLKACHVMRKLKDV